MRLFCGNEDSEEGGRLIVDIQRDSGRNKTDELLTCAICDSYLKRSEGFTCPRCRRGPLCRTHRVSGRKECSSCVFELTSFELADLRRQQAGIKGFLNLMQFLFLVFAVLFISVRTGIAESVDFLQYGFITDTVTYIGIASVSGYILFFIIMIGQKNRISEIEAILKKTSIRRFNK